LKPHYDKIKENSNIIEHRIDDSFCTKKSLIKENRYNLEMCKKHMCNYVLIEKDYLSVVDNILDDLLV